MMNQLIKDLTVEDVNDIESDIEMFRESIE
jgi:hypothetical protein